MNGWRRKGDGGSDKGRKWLVEGGHCGGTNRGNTVGAGLGGGCICASFLSFSHLGIMALDNRRSSVCHPVFAEPLSSWLAADSPKYAVVEQVRLFNDNNLP